MAANEHRRRALRSRGAMTRFAVPRQYHQGLKLLASLEDAEREALVRELSGAGDFRSVTQLEKLIAGALPDEHAEDADEVLDALMRLRRQLTYTEDTTAERFAEDVASAPGIEIGAEEGRDAFARLLVALLETRAIATTAAAAQLLVQHERPYRLSRIVSEIRPVFVDSVDDPPPGAVLVHTLQLGFWRSEGGTDAMDFALDHADLLELSRVVERALRKASTLRTLLQSSGLESFDVGEEGA